MRALTALLLCACAGQDTDPPTHTASCVVVQAPDPLELDGTLGPTETVVTLASSCTTTTSWTATLADGYEGRISLSPLDGSIEPGATAAITVSFNGNMMGSAFDTLTVASPSNPTPTPIEVIATGPTPKPVLTGVPNLVPRACALSVDLAIEQQGTGHARLTEVSIRANEDAEFLVPNVQTPVSILPGDPLVLSSVLTLTGPTATIDVQMTEQLLGDVTTSFDVGLDHDAEVEQIIEPQPDGPALDVIVTVDRDLSPTHKSKVDAALQALLEHLDQHVDYRVAGLIRDDGCPLNRTLPTVDRTWDTAEAAGHLAAIMDLKQDRYSPTDGRRRIFDRVQSALAAANTQPDGCNAWRRADTALLTWHIAAHDDESVIRDGAEHVGFLRTLVPYPDMVRVAGIVGPPPAGCDGAASGQRLSDAADVSGGRMYSVCDARWSDGIKALDIDSIGDARRIILESDPLPESLVVSVDGEAISAWTLTGKLLAVDERAWDHRTQRLRIQYVPAEVCGG